VYISCTGMYYVSVIRSICIFLPTSEFRSALARPKALECVYHPCPTLTCRASVLRLARIWMVGSYGSCCLVEMMTLLTAFAVIVAAAVEAFCCPA
jgi:hypothetical protein